MSYILEALASSEQARQQVPAAPKYSLLPVVGEHARKRRLWPYAVAAVLIVNASALYFLARPVSLPEVQIATPAAVSTPVQTPPKPQPQRVAEPVVVRAPAPVVMAAKVEPKKPEPKKREPKQPETVVKAADPQPAPPPPEASALPPPPMHAVSRFELPPGLHRELPALSVAGYIREEGSSGMVIVNDKLLHEGDELVPGLKLEKILQDSLVFNYKGYRFKP